MTEPKSSDQDRETQQGKTQLGGTAIFDPASGLVVAKHWFSKNTVRFSICAVIASFMLVYPPEGLLGDEITYRTLLFIGLAVFAAGTSYYSLAGWLNKTVVFVTGGRLRVRHGPIPWWGNKDISTREVVRFFSRKKTVKRTGLLNNRVVESFAVYAEVKAGSPVLIIKGIEVETQSEAVIKALEQALDSAENGGA